MRSNTLDAARRVYMGLVRGTVHKVDDKPRMQVVDARLLHDELLPGIEHFQNYGFGSVPRPPDEKGGKAAEVIVGFLHGNRSHPVVLTVQDRCFRPRDWKSGDSGLWHYKGATARFTDDGWKHDAGPDKKPYEIKVGRGLLHIADDKVFLKLGDGDDAPTVTIKDGKVYLGGDPDKGGTYDFVMTASGPSSNVKAKL